MSNELLIIVGPTASGKTALAVNIAQKINGEIVSADSMQIYQHMNIGSAKPSIEEMGGIPHHLMDFLSPFEAYSVADYQHDATNAIRDIHSRGKTAIVAGGTGLYINSLITGMDFAQAEPSQEIRDELNNIAQSMGTIKLHGMLKEVDPESAARISENDLKRLIRALEIYKTTGKPMSQQKTAVPALFKAKIIALNMDRELLYDRINRRVDIMLEAGLLDELEKLINMGCKKDMQAMMGIGYKELFDYYDQIISLDEAVELIKKRSRNYAKRQITWFKRYEEMLWLDSSAMSMEELTECALDYYNFGGKADGCSSGGIAQSGQT